VAVAVAIEPELPQVEPWSQAELLNNEKETLGFYITGHPLERYHPIINDFANSSIERLKTVTPGETVKIGGMIGSINIRTTKKGDRFALCQLEDQFGSVKIVVWPDVYNKISAKLKAEAPVLISGRLEVEDEGAMSIIADDLQFLDGIRERNARSVLVRVKSGSISADKIEKLYDLIDSNRGECQISFGIELADRSIAYIKPSPYVRINPNPELIDSIRSLCGECRVDLNQR
jgi:DNA polymerase III subunit alpha